MISILTIPTPSPVTITVSGAWSQWPPWDWKGNVVAPEPIIALTFLRVGRRVEWVRSEKTVHDVMEVRLLLGRYDSGGRDVEVCFGIGGNSVRCRTTLNDANSLPDVSETGNFQAGVSFSFCAPFGSPEVHLGGLVLLRRQAVSARSGIWHLKPEYSERLSERWKSVFTYARSGAFEMTDSKAEPGAAPNGGPATPVGSSRVAEGPPSVNRNVRSF